MQQILKIAKLFQIKLAQRQKGKSLPETGYKERYAQIFRAVPANVLTFEPMSYVTLSRKWAKGHADHSVIVNDEPYHVLMALVPATDLFETQNVGANEFFYDGKEKKGHIIYTARP
jgi:hypothetical protein